jgi:hypothetical protein
VPNGFAGTTRADLPIHGGTPALLADMYLSKELSDETAAVIASE